MIGGVIFDIDGTLVDSVDAHTRAWQLAFEHFGKHLAYQDVRDQIGKGGDQLMPVFLSPEEMQRFGKQLEDYRSALYKRDFLPNVRGFPLVRDLFLRLKADGLEVALASSAKGDELAHYKRVAGIDDLVDTETSADDAEKSKPHPDIFEAALDKLHGLDADRIVVVGDSPFDAIAARRAGLRAIGVLSGGFPASKLRQAGFIGLYEDPADLLHRYSTWTQPMPARPVRPGQHPGVRR